MINIAQEWLILEITNGGDPGPPPISEARVINADTEELRVTNSDTQETRIT